MRATVVSQLHFAECWTHGCVVKKGENYYAVITHENPGSTPETWVYRSNKEGKIKPEDFQSPVAGGLGLTRAKAIVDLESRRTP